MIVSSEPVNVKFCDNDGKTIATMDLFAETDGNGPFIIPQEEATDNGETKVQLLEAANYEYTLRHRGFRLRELSGLVRRSRTDNDYDRGRITPGLNVGRLRFVLLSNTDNSPTGTAEVEIRAVKVTYRDEYRRMLEYITYRCTDLLLEFRAPTEQTVIPEETREPEIQHIYPRSPPVPVPVAPI